MTRKQTTTVLALICAAAVASAQPHTSIEGMYEYTDVDLTYRVVAVDFGDSYLLRLLYGEQSTQMSARAVLIGGGDQPRFELRDGGEATGIAFTPTQFEIGEEAVVPLAKIGGKRDELPGVYRIVIEQEGEIELELAQEDGELLAHMSAWQVTAETIAPKRADNTYRLITDEGEEIEIRFRTDGATMVTRTVPDYPFELTKVELENFSRFSARAYPPPPAFADRAIAGAARRVFEQFTGLPYPDSATRTAEQLAVEWSRTIEPELSYLSSLSPDGSSYLTYSGNEIAVYSVEDDEPISSSPVETGFSAPYSVRWSPDGSSFAFSRDYFRMLLDSDIFRYEVSSGLLTNLTDEGTDDYRPFSGGGGIIDITPVWVDRRTVLAQRMIDTGNWKIELIEIDVHSGKISPSVSLLHELPYTLDLRFSPGSGNLLLSIMGVGRNDKRAGTWLLEARDLAPHQLLPVDRPENHPQNVIDVTIDGRFAIVAGTPYLDRGDFGSADPPFLLEVATGETRPLIPDLSEEAHLEAVIFSPDGSKLLYSYRNEERETSVLAVRNLASGGDAQTLLEEDAMTGAATGSIFGGAALFWAANDVIMVVRGAGSSATLLQLR